MGQLNLYLKKRGEDVAFTFKGLYKMHDSLKKEQLVITVICFVCSALPVFDIVYNIFFLKILSFLAMGSSVWLLHRNSEYQKIENYAKLANEFKSIYDYINRIYLIKSEEFDIEKLDKDIKALNKKTQDLPISKRQYSNVKKTIKSEMDLEWIIKKED